MVQTASLNKQKDQAILCLRRIHCGESFFMVAGARPNFMKIAPIYRAALAYSDIDCRIIHTGQHYDYEMSQAFFEDLEIPKPQYFLDAGSGSHAVHTAKIMVAFEEVCIKEKPDLVMVVGDVDSTPACSIVAKKLLIDVAHVTEEHRRGSGGYCKVLH